MKSRMTSFVLVLLLVVLGVAVGAAAATSGRTGSLNTVGNSVAGGADITADAVAASRPDIRTVTVSRDPAGTLSFVISFAAPVTLGSETRMEVMLDTDRNSSTGIQGGEYALDYSSAGDGEMPYASLFTARNGETDVSTPSSLHFSSTPSSASFGIAAADIGGPASFDFWVFIEQNHVLVDTAPAGLLSSPYLKPWTYPKGGVLAAGQAYPVETYQDVSPTPAEGPFTDPVGDAGGAPDISGVRVTDANGVVTLTVTASGFGPVSDVTVYLDTDKNPETGSTTGGEYSLVAFSDSSGTSLRLLRWNGAWQVSTRSPTTSFTHSGDNAVFAVAASDLGGAKGFDFWVATGRYDTSVANMTGEDVAPDNAHEGGRFVYDLSSPRTSPPLTVRPVIGKPVVTPARPQAGKLFTVTFNVTRSGSPLTNVTMVCDPSLAGKVIPHAESYQAGNARLSFVVPKAAKGKLLKVKLTIRAKGQSASKTVSFRVR